jgi:hypothetical protein
MNTTRHRSTLYRAGQVQLLYMEHKSEDITNTYIFRQIIRPRFHITERTFYRYLNMKVPAKLFRSLQEETNETASLTV